ncbi:hypothetical protein [Butyrivibrio sp. AC2005]|uniref:hypothetical protein n=1 Tax=Butyrivibrio sp. AC2005 TaxID=1280672 RepID=UPI0004202BA2|nr:hypothetical protein [Butyrivibrio sp. AC2005]
MNIEGIKDTDNQNHIYTHSLKPEDNKASRSTFLEIFNSRAQDYVQDKRPCEYFDMADKNGFISYKRAVFVCNYNNNTLELGNCSDERNCIRVKLSKGGSLLVNRDNIDDLLMSISMFSAKDQGLIMQAVMKDKMAQEAKRKSEEHEEVDKLMDMVKED